MEAEQLDRTTNGRGRVVVVVAAVVGVVFFVVQGGGGSSSDDSSSTAVVESYGDAVIRGDDAAAAQLTCEDLRQSPRATDELENIEGLERSVDGQVTELRATNAMPENDDEERVSGEYHLDSGGEAATGQFEAIAVRNQDGSWSFCGFEVFGPPVIDD